RGILPTLSNKAWRALIEIEQVLFAAQAAAIAAELPDFIFDAMGRNDDRDAICSVGMPDGALSGRRPDAPRECFIRTGLAIRNAEQFIPDTHLKGRSRKNQGNRK